jgi:isopentenyl phosphate kinase
MSELVFLKLGGSIITDKDQPNTAKLKKIDEIADEIKRAIHAAPEIKLLIGHGSGSFGHTAAEKFYTRNGVTTPLQWEGFSEVGNRARALNQIIIDRFEGSGLRSLAFSPLSSIIASNREIIHWDTNPIETCLKNKILPIVYGDIIFDNLLGGTILSTEELFLHLASKLKPSRILLSGLEEGVWRDFPSRQNLLNEITPSSYAGFKEGISKSSSPDVTGGMSSKVNAMIKLLHTLPDLEIQIFSALHPGNIYAALLGKIIGTVIRKIERKNDDL